MYAYILANGNDRVKVFFCLSQSTSISFYEVLCYLIEWRQPKARYWQINYEYPPCPRPPWLHQTWHSDGSWICHRRSNRFLRLHWFLFSMNLGTILCLCQTFSTPPLLLLQCFYGHLPTWNIELLRIKQLLCILTFSRTHLNLFLLSLSDCQIFPLLLWRRGLHLVRVANVGSGSVGNTYMEVQNTTK